MVKKLTIISFCWLSRSLVLSIIIVTHQTGLRRGSRGSRRERSSVSNEAAYCSESLKRQA